jgi:hypothetical protein
VLVCVCGAMSENKVSEMYYNTVLLQSI